MNVLIRKCLENNKNIFKSQQRFWNEAHNVFTEKVNKTALNANDDRRARASD